MKRALIKFLGNHGWYDILIDYANNNRHRKYRENMEYAFSDSKGRNYFYYPDLMDMPLTINEKLKDLQDQLAAKIPGRDLDAWAVAVEGVLNDPKRNDKITQFGYWLGVLKERRSILFDPTILMEIAALMYIREDENQYTYNEEIHKEKFHMIWNDSKEGALLYDFFHKSGLKAFMPSSGVTSENWEKYLTEILSKMAEFNTRLSQISTYASGYAIDRKTMTEV